MDMMMFISVISAVVQTCLVWQTYGQAVSTAVTSYAGLPKYELMYHSGASTWHEANNTCVDNGGRLVTLLSENSQIMIEHFNETLWDGSLTDDFWIGLYESDSLSELYIWSDGGQLNNTDKAVLRIADWRYLPSRYCVKERVKDKKWISTDCDDKFSFICEKHIGDCIFSIQEKQDVQTKLLDSSWPFFFDSLNIHSCMYDCLNERVSDPWWVFKYTTDQNEDTDSGVCYCYATSFKERLSLEALVTSPTTTTALTVCYEGFPKNISSFTSTLKVEQTTNLEMFTTTPDDTGINRLNAKGSDSLPVEGIPTATRVKFADMTVTGTSDSSSYPVQLEAGHYQTVRDADVGVTVFEASSTETTSSSPLTQAISQAPTRSIHSDDTQSTIIPSTDGKMKTLQRDLEQSSLLLTDEYLSTETKTDSITTNGDLIGDKEVVTNYKNEITASELVSRVTLGLTTELYTKGNGIKMCCCSGHPGLINGTREMFMKDILKTLHIERGNVSSWKRKYASAVDNRRSSEGIGYLGICFIATVFGGFILLDLQTLVVHIKGNGREF